MRNSEIASKNRKREKRKFHIRKRVRGTAERPRLTVFKSNRYMYMQAVDDASGTTLAACSSLEEALKSCARGVEGAAKLGEEMGRRLKEKNITQVVFDRNGYLYHGVVKALADGARKAGIQF
jgi:large subunit ribosomal protein L18